MGHSREAKCERRGMPKWAEPRWIKLAAKYRFVASLDDSLTRAHTECIKGVVVVDDWLFTGSWDAYGKLWHVETGALLQVMKGHRQDIIGVCGTKTRLGSTRFFTSADSVRCWDPLNGDCVSLFGSGTYYAALATPTHVFCCTSQGPIEKYAFGEEVEKLGTVVQGRVVSPYKSATPETVLTGHQKGCMGLDLSVADNVLVSCSLDMTAIVWDLSTGQPRHRLSGHTDQLRDVVLFKERRNFFDDPDDPKAAGAPSAQPGALARVQSAGVAAGAKGKAGPARSASSVVRVMPAPSGGATAGGAGTGATAATTAGVKRARHLQVFTCGLDHTIVQWDGETGERLRRLVGHSAPVRGLVIVNSTLFSCSSDFTVRQWDTASGKELLKFSGHTEEVFGLCSAHGSLFTCSKDKITKRWDLGAGRDMVLVSSQEYRSADVQALIWPVLSLVVVTVQVLSFTLSSLYPWPDIMLPIRIPALLLVLSLDMFTLPPVLLAAYFWTKWAICVGLCALFVGLFVSDLPTDLSILADQGLVLLQTVKAKNGGRRDASAGGDSSQLFDISLLDRLGIDVSQVDVKALRESALAEQRRFAEEQARLEARRLQWLEEHKHDLVFDLPLEAMRAQSFLADARYGQLTLSLDQLGVQLDAAASQPRLEKVLARYERQKNVALFFMQVMCLIGMLPMMTISITVFGCKRVAPGVWVWAVDEGNTVCYVGWHAAACAISVLTVSLCMPLMILLVMAGGDFRCLPTAQTGASRLQKLWAKFSNGLASNAATIDIGILTRQPSAARFDELLTALMRMLLVGVSVASDSVPLAREEHLLFGVIIFVLLVGYLSTLFFIQPFKWAEMNAFIFVARLIGCVTALLGILTIAINDKSVIWTGVAWYCSMLLIALVGTRIGRVLMAKCKCGYEISGTLASTKLWPLLGR